MELTKKNITPDDIDTSDRFWDSPLKDLDKEVIARNLVILSQVNDNLWLSSFTWEDYKNLCEREGGIVHIRDKGILDSFVASKLLSFEDGKYTIEDNFIRILEKFIKNNSQEKECD